MSPARERQETPEPDFEDPKELYAFFGLASYEAQLLEMSLINLAVALKFAEGGRLYRDVGLAAYATYEGKTFGQLLRSVSTAKGHLDELVPLLTAAVEKRNYLMHRFFREHAADLMAEAGRRKMILELRDMTALFHQADIRVDPIWRDEWSRLGFSDAMLQQEFDKLVAELEGGAA